MKDYHLPFTKYYILYSDVVYSTDDLRVIQNLENCYYIKRGGSLIKPLFYVNYKENEESNYKTEVFNGYNKLMDYINVIDEEQYICFIGFSKTLMHELIKTINCIKGCGIEFSKIDFLDKKNNQKSL